ncbi:MAG: hypothetical protein K2Y32_01855 [Candidatus Obscuribacterales bacterium]|nr:hypothetical protein [Candidatus Obscuribacterales bacterium]
MPNKQAENSEALFGIKLDYNCPLSWKDLDGNEQVRNCRRCKQNVYNLSMMTRDEAYRFIKETEGKECVAFYQRRDGKLITRDCVSILGRQELTAKYNFWAWINFLCSAGLLAILQIVGPAGLCTLFQGVGPIMVEESETKLEKNTKPKEDAIRKE